MLYFEISVHIKKRLATPMRFSKHLKVTSPTVLPQRDRDELQIVFGEAIAFPYSTKMELGGQ